MRNIEFNLADVINKTNEFISYISGFKNVVYLFRCITENKYYVGITNNILYRLFSEIGHLYNIDKIDGVEVYGSRLQNSIARNGISNFTYSIIYSSEDYKEVDDLEPKFIKEYNSCYDGYNCSTSGKMANGDIRVNNGSRNIFIKPWEIEEAAAHGFNRRGSLSSSRIYVTDGMNTVSIYKDEYDIFRSEGFIAITDSNKDNISSMTSSELPHLYSDYVNNSIKFGKTPDRDRSETDFTIAGKVGYTEISTKRYFLIDPSEEYKYQNDPRYVKGNLNMNLTAGQVFVNKDGKNKRIDRSELDFYLSDGWSRGFKKRTPKKVRIHKGDVEIRVLPEEVDFYLSEGWEKGGKKRLTSRMIDSEGNIHTVSKSEIQDKESLGWKRIKNNRRTGEIAGAGSIYVNNGIEGHRIRPEELPEYEKKGFLRGRLLKNK